MTTVGLLIAAASSYVVIRHASQPLRIALAVYLGAYTLTSVIGALLTVHYYLFMNVLAPLVDAAGLDLRWLDNLDGSTFLVVLLSPFVVVPLVSWLFWNIRWPILTAPLVKARISGPALLFAYVVVYATYTAWCLWKVVNAGLVHRFLEVDLLWTSYEAHLFARAEGFAKLGNNYLSLTYTSLPTLSFVALAAWLRSGRIAWAISFFLSVAIAVWLLLITAQKAPLFVYALFLGVAIVLWTRARAVTVAVSLVGLVVLNGVLEFVLGTPFDVLHSALGLFLRMGAAVPFYVSIYPTLEPHPGADLWLSLLGLGSYRYMDVASTVSNYMAAGYSPIQGFAPAAAHITAYAEDGLAFMLLCEVLVAVAVFATAKVLAFGKGSIGSASSIALLVMLYYLTQVSLRLSIIGSYGVAYALLPLILLAVGGVLVSTAIARMRLAAPAG